MVLRQEGMEDKRTYDETDPGRLGRVLEGLVLRRNRIGGIKELNSSKSWLMLCIEVIVVEEEGC